MKRHEYAVYFIANAEKQIYTGMTGNLHHRIWQHKEKQLDCMTNKFNVCRLVYYEKYGEVADAIHREKQIKRWRREKKIVLIEKMNLNWHDLSEGWFENPYDPTPKALPLDSPPKTRLARGDRRGDK